MGPVVTWIDYANALEIDLDPLLNPISEDKPSGEWLRYEPLYGKIQEARRADDESLPQGIWKTNPKRADNGEVIRLCQQALKSQTKDVQLAVWLCEAWSRVHGPRGLCVGMLLISELLDRFWETLYPVLDENGDSSYRLAPLSGLDRALSLQLKLLPLTQPVVGQERILCYADWERAQRAKPGAEEEPGALSAATYLGLAAATPARTARILRTQLHEVHKSAERLEAVIDRKTGATSAAVRELRATVQSVVALIGQFPQLGSESQVTTGPQEGAASDIPSVVSAPSISEVSVPSSASGSMEVSGRGGIRSRAEAYARLSEAAEFLIRTEPHSPVPYLIRRAVTWGGMSLVQLLDELVQEDSDRRAIFALLAMREPRSE